jgi:hypothetical protein
MPIQQPVANVRSRCICPTSPIGTRAPRCELVAARSMGVIRAGGSIAVVDAGQQPVAVAWVDPGRCGCCTSLLHIGHLWAGFCAGMPLSITPALAALVSPALPATGQSCRPDRAQSFLSSPVWDWRSGSGWRASASAYSRNRSRPSGVRRRFGYSGIQVLCWLRSSSLRREILS